MKKQILLGIALGVAVILPRFALAASSVQVYPTIVNAYGGTKNATDLRSEISQGIFKQSEYGVPTYVLPGPGEYTVKFFAPAGYSYTTDGNCDSSVGEDETKVCHVFWNDGAPIVPAEPLPPAPVTPIPSDPVTLPPAGSPSPSEPTDLPVAPPVFESRVIEVTATSSPEIETTLGTTTTIIIIKEVPVVVFPTSTVEAIASIQANQERTLTLLERIGTVVEWLADAFKRVWGWI